MSLTARTETISRDMVVLSAREQKEENATWSAVNRQLFSFVINITSLHFYTALKYP